MKIITLIPGDGIGPEVTRRWCGSSKPRASRPSGKRSRPAPRRSKEHGTTLPQPLLDSITRNKIALKGPITTPVGKGFTSVNVGCARRSISTPTCARSGICRRCRRATPDVDLVIVRENTEDLYAGLEHIVVPGVVESIKIITEKASTRIAEFAFDQARRRGRKKVTAVHKANIMKLSDGLFLECARRWRRGIPTSSSTIASSMPRACTW